MTILDIDQSLTFTLSDGTILTGIIVGRNWTYDTLESYIVRHKWEDRPVCPKTLKSQVGW